MCLQTASSLEDLYCIHIDILKFTNIRVSKRIQRSNKHCLILWFQVNLAQQKTSIYISKWRSRKQLHLSIKSISWIQQYGTTTDNFIHIDIMLSKNHGSAADKLLPIMQMRGTCLPCAWQRPLPSDCHISTLQYSTSLNYTIVS